MKDRLPPTAVEALPSATVRAHLPPTAWMLRQRAPSGTPPRADMEEHKRFYVPIPAKYVLAMLLALAWLTFSVVVSRPWMEDLGRVTHPLFAIVCLTFVAYVPGFMNAFMIVSLLLDQRPRRRPLTIIRR